MTCRTRTGPWTPQTALRLTVLAAAAFIYVTAETVPVGALPSIARDLHVGEALVGDLLAWYALVAAVTTVPLVAWTARWTRRRALLATLICLTTSQLLSALAPNFTMLACARLLCALTHGLMWSVIAPIAARLVPASHSGRATTTIYVGTSLALVVGNPLTAAMSLLWGWRWAVVVVTAAAALITVAAAVTLPVMEPVVEAPAGRGSAVGDRVRRYANSGMATLGVLTLTVVAGHFISYTFIVVVITDVVGVEGPRLAWLLAAFGVAGLVAMPLVGGPLDRQPKTAIGVCMAAFVAACRAGGVGVRWSPRRGRDRDRSRGDRGVGGDGDGGDADAAVGGDAHLAAGSGRGLGRLRRDFSGRDHGRLVAGRGVIRTLGCTGDAGGFGDAARRRGGERGGRSTALRRCTKGCATVTLATP